jgi:hypothetical protein
VFQLVIGENMHCSVCSQDFARDVLNFLAEIWNWIAVVIYLRLPLVTRESILLMGEQDGQGGSVAGAPHF